MFDYAANGLSNRNRDVYPVAATAPTQPVSVPPQTTNVLRLSMHTLGGLLKPLSAETAALLAPLEGIGVLDQIEIGVYNDLEHFTVEVFKRYSDAHPKMAPTGYMADPRNWSFRVPCSRVDEKGRLICPTTDFTVIVLCALWEDDRITFQDERARIVFQSLAVQFRTYFITAQMQAEYKANGYLTPIAKEFPNPAPTYSYDGELIEQIEFSGYQRCAAACGAMVPGYAFFMEQGTGKTPVTIIQLEYEARKFRESEAARLAADPEYKPRPYRFIVVCDKSLRSNWESELRKFSAGGLRGRSFVLRGDYISRCKTIMDVAITPSTLTANQGTYFTESGADWVCLIMSYGLMRRDKVQLGSLGWDRGILDESQNISNPKNDQTHAALEIRDFCARRNVLTGTPIPNRVSELYCQLEFLGKGFSGFKSHSAFKKYYEQIIEIDTGNGHPIQKLIGLQNMPILQERLARMSFIISKAEALEGLPPKVRDIVEVQMSRQQRETYERVCRKMLVDARKELGGCEDDGRNYNMILQNVLKRMLRLTQITSGFFVSDQMIDDDGNILHGAECHRFDPNPKLEALINLVKPKPRTSKFQTWCSYKQDVRTISARLKVEGIDHVVYTGDTSDADRETAVYRFNHDFNCQGWVGTSAGGVGLNLLGQANEFTNCDHVIYFSQDYSARKRMQSEDRAHRRGTRTVVRVTDLMVPGTVDEQIRACVVEKRINSSRVQDVRDLLGKLAAGLENLTE